MDAFAILYGLNVAFAVQEKKAISEITTEKQRNNSNLKKDNPIYCHIKNENRTKDHKKHKKHIIQQPNKPNNAQHAKKKQGEWVKKTTITKKTSCTFFFVEKNTKKQKPKRMNYQTQIFFQIFLTFIIVAFVISILLWNLQLCKKTEIAYEQYRTVCQEIIYECIDADNISQEQPLESLLKISQAKAKLLSTAQIVGGLITLRVLSGLDVVQVHIFINTLEEKIHNLVVEKGLLKQHPLLNKLFGKYENDELP